MKFEQLQNIASKHDGKTEEFNQMKYLASNPFVADVQNGVCRALCAAFLVRQYTRAVTNFEQIVPTDLREKAETFGTKDFLDAFNDEKPERNQSKLDRQRFESISKIQAKYSKDSPSESDLVSAAEKSIKYFSKSMMKKKSVVPVLTFGQGVTDDTLSDDGYWMVSGDGHMVALSKRAFEAKFFDPNAGVVTFDMFEIENLVPFLNEYLPAAGKPNSQFIMFN